MNNLLSYCGLVDVRINASGKDLPVPRTQVPRSLWYLEEKYKTVGIAFVER